MWKSGSQSFEQGNQEKACAYGYQSCAEHDDERKADERSYRARPQLRSLLCGVADDRGTADQSECQPDHADRHLDPRRHFISCHLNRPSIQKQLSGLQPFEPLT